MLRLRVNPLAVKDGWAPRSPLLALLASTVQAQGPVAGVVSFISALLGAAVTCCLKRAGDSLLTARPGAQAGDRGAVILRLGACVALLGVSSEVMRQSVGPEMWLAFVGSVLPACNLAVLLAGCMLVGSTAPADQRVRLL